MKRALIIEDEQFSAERMQKLVDRHTNLSVEKVLFSVESAVDWLDHHKAPDVIFLDIQLGDGTGFDVLDRIQSFPYIIFTTAFDKYTLRAFKYNSVDYLLKPIKGEELEAAVHKFERLQGTSELETKLEDLKRDLLRTYKGKFLI